MQAVKMCVYKNLVKRFPGVQMQHQSRMNPFLWLGICAGLILFCGLAAPSYAGSDWVEWVAEALEKNDSIASARADLDAARSRVRVARGGWYPGFELNLDYGTQDNFNDDSSVSTGEARARVRQLLWDANVVGAGVQRSEIDLLQKELTLRQVEQRVMNEALIAYINWVSNGRTLEFARQSVDNIQRQTGLEEIRVEQGMGFSTDLLQAQSQLAGARSRLIQSQERFAQAQHRFEELFFLPPPPIDATDYPDDSRLLRQAPLSLENALELAEQSNLQLRLLELAEEQAQVSVAQARSEVARPRLDLVLERNWKQNDAGIRQPDKNELILELQFSMGFDLGLTGRDAVSAARSDLRSRRDNSASERKAIERQVRDAWIAHESARQRAAALAQQSEITAAFLRLARRERELGTRSLLDVLAGETALINAQADQESAQAAALIATLNLLEKLSLLDIEILR